MSGNAHCRRILVSGRVQGVGFRAATARQARSLGLRGYAENLADGRVEVLAWGDAGAVGELLAWLEEGPPPARVEDLRSEELEAGEADLPEQFQIR